MVSAQGTDAARGSTADKPRRALELTLWTTMGVHLPLRTTRWLTSLGRKELETEARRRGKAKGVWEEKVVGLEHDGACAVPPRVLEPQLEPAVGEPLEPALDDGWASDVGFARLFRGRRRCRTRA